MEFKGTKEKWRFSEEYFEVTSSKCGVLESSKGICVINEYAMFDYTKQTAKANALLISKAPEMLDFINRISGEMLRNDFVLDEKWYEQAQELIKQATEI